MILLLGAMAAGLLATGARGDAAKPGDRAATSSFYTVRPDDPKAVFVTRDGFGAVGDGPTPRPWTGGLRTWVSGRRLLCNATHPRLQRRHARSRTPSKT